jgi:sugar/nucleoside kinase (ribokinase family)
MSQIDLVQPDTASKDSFSSTWLALSAGGPMNSAVALGKLGADTHFLSRLSQDAFGRQLRQHILDVKESSRQAMRTSSFLPRQRRAAPRSAAARAAAIQLSWRDVGSKITAWGLW